MAGLAGSKLTRGNDGGVGSEVGLHGQAELCGGSQTKQSPRPNPGRQARQDRCDRRLRSKGGRVEWQPASKFISGVSPVYCSVSHLAAKHVDLESDLETNPDVEPQR